MQDRQPSFVTDDNDDEDLCAEEKARKEEARGVSSKSRGSLFAFNTLPKLVVEKMDLLEDGATSGEPSKRMSRG